MKTNNLKSLIGAAALCATLAVPQLASAAVTPPVGYVKLTFNAESDTAFSLPMNRPMVYSGQTSSVLGNVISIADNDFDASEFVYDFTDDNDDSNDQRERYYILFTTGALEGRSFDVVSNTANSLTVDPDHNEDNTALEVSLEELIDGVSSGDTFEIRPHWTLDALLPEGEGFPQAGSILAQSSEIHTRSTDVDGINLSTSNSYKYVTGTGWVDNGDLLTGQIRDVILRRNVGLIARNRTSDDLELNVVGDVPTTDAFVNLKTNVITQDNHVSFTLPVDITLAQTGLDTSGAFEARSSILANDGDFLLLFDSEQTGFNIAPSITYFYVSSLGWVDDSDLFGGAIDATQVIIPAGAAVVIRKSDEGVVDSEFLPHKTPMTYDPFTE